MGYMYVFFMFFFIQSDGYFKATETLVNIYKNRLKIACEVYICALWNYHI